MKLHTYSDEVVRATWTYPGDNEKVLVLYQCPNQFVIHWFQGSERYAGHYFVFAQHDGITEAYRAASARFAQIITNRL